MIFRQRTAAGFFVLPFVFVCTFCPVVRASSKSPIAELSAKLKRELSDSKVSSLAIADFTDTGGNALPEGVYFADLVNSYLAGPPKRFELLNRSDLGKVHVNEKTTKAIAYGTIDDAPQEILLRVFVRRTTDQTLVADEQITIPQSEFYRNLSSYPNRLAPSEVFRAGEKGIDSPQCQDCPAPQFRGPADRKTEKSPSTVILLGLIITAEGRVANVRVLKGAGPEFEDMAWQAIRVFRFKPAKNKAGQSVAAALTMEVFFTGY